MLSHPRRAWLLSLVLAACTGQVSGGDGGAADRAPDAGHGTRNQDDDAGSAPISIPGCTLETTVGGIPTWAHFTDPVSPCTPGSTGGRDLHIVAELERLIDATPAGETIRGNIKSISVELVAEALVDAEARGVQVFISVDGRVAWSDDAAVSILERLSHQRYCQVGTGCISSVYGGIAHTKLFTFSRTVDPRGAGRTAVVWLGSANLTYGADGTDGYNDAVTVYGDAALHDQLRGYLEHMYAASPRYVDFYDAPDRGYYPAAAAHVYASPEAAKEIVVDRLNDITPDSMCEVRVMNAWITTERAPVTNHLIAMKDGGCSLQVMTLHITDSQLDKLRAAGVTVKAAHASTKIHDKVVTVHGLEDGARVHRVYTGSHNFNEDGLRNSDEIFVKMAPSAELYDAFVAHFDSAWDQGRVLTEGTE